MKQIDLNNEIVSTKARMARPSLMSSWKEKLCG